MYNDIVYTNNCSYPGEYVPLLKKEQFDREVGIFHEGERLVPPVNISELPDAYKVDVAIPGIRREELLVHIEGNVLFIRVLHKETGLTAVPTFQLHEFNYVCFERHIDLPANADSAFMSAEYKAGILQVIIPKTTCPIDGPCVQVAVY